MLCWCLSIGAVAADVQQPRSTEIVILNWWCNAVKDLCWVCNACVFVSVFGFVGKNAHKISPACALCVTKIGVCEWKTKDAPATKLHNYFKMASLYRAHTIHSFCSFAYLLRLLATHIFFFCASLIHSVDNFFSFFVIRHYFRNPLHTSYSHLANSYAVQAVYLLLSACCNLKHVLFLLGKEAFFFVYHTFEVCKLPTFPPSIEHRPRKDFLLLSRVFFIFFLMKNRRIE